MREPDTDAFERPVDTAWGRGSTAGQTTLLQTFNTARQQMRDQLRASRGRPPSWRNWLHGLWALGKIVWHAVAEYFRNLFVALRWMVARWLNQNPGRFTQVVEIAGWPMVFAALAWWSNPGNPLYVNEGFPWPWLGVWLVALRYGVLAGVVGVLLLLAMWWVVGGQNFPRLYFLGGAITTLIAGEFGGFWGARTTRYRESIDYLNEKIERLTRRLYLLKLSHDELEYEMVDRPGTLRDALMQLRELMARELRNNRRADNQLPAAKAMLTLLANYTQVEVAGLYLLKQGPVTDLNLVAKIGSALSPDSSEPMVRQAIELRQSVHVQESVLDQIERTPCLLVAPLLDEEGEAFGLLVVNRMPFMGVHHDNLRHIWVLVQTYSEYLRSNRLGDEYVRLWPKAPLELRQEFARLSHLSQRYGIESHCVVWRIYSRRAPVIAEHVRQAHQAGEQAWLFRTGDEIRLVSLFVFADASHVAVATTKILETARQRGGLSVDAVAKVSVEAISLSSTRAFPQVVQLLTSADTNSSVIWDETT